MAGGRRGARMAKSASRLFLVSHATRIKRHFVVLRKTSKYFIVMINRGKCTGGILAIVRSTAQLSEFECTNGGTAEHAQARREEVAPNSIFHNLIWSATHASERRQRLQRIIYISTSGPLFACSA